MIHSVYSVIIVIVLCVIYAVKCGFGSAHGTSCCYNMGARGGMPYHRAMSFKGIVPTLHTVDGPVTLKLKLGTINSVVVF